MRICVCGASVSVLARAYFNSLRVVRVLIRSASAASFLLTPGDLSVKGLVFLVMTSFMVTCND